MEAAMTETGRSTMGSREYLIMVWDGVMTAQETCAAEIRSTSIDKTVKGLNLDLFSAELRLWREALGLHNDHDQRSHAWHLPEIESSPVTTVWINDQRPDTRNEIVVVAERRTPILFCRRKADW